MPQRKVVYKAMTVTVAEQLTIPPRPDEGMVSNAELAAMEATYAAPSAPEATVVVTPTEPQVTRSIGAPVAESVAETAYEGVSKTARFIGRVFTKDYKPGGTIVGKTLAWTQLRIDSFAERIAERRAAHAGAAADVQQPFATAEDSKAPESRVRLSGKQIAVIVGLYAVAGVKLYSDFRSAGIMPSHITLPKPYMTHNGGSASTSIDISKARPVAYETPLHEAIQPKSAIESPINIQLQDHILTIHDGTAQTNLDLSGLSQHQLTLKGNILQITEPSGVVREITLTPQDMHADGTLSDHVRQQLEGVHIKLGMSTMHTGDSAPVQHSQEAIKYFSGNEQGLDISHSGGKIIITMHTHAGSAFKPDQIVITGKGPAGQAASVELPLHNGRVVIDGHTPLGKDILAGRVTVRGAHMRSNGVIDSSATIPASSKAPSILDGGAHGQRVELGGSSTTYNLSDAANPVHHQGGNANWIQEVERYSQMGIIENFPHKEMLAKAAAIAAAYAILTTAIGVSLNTFGKREYELSEAGTLKLSYKERLSEKDIKVVRAVPFKKRQIIESLKRNVGLRNAVPLAIISGMLLHSQVGEAFHSISTDWPSWQLWLSGHADTIYNALPERISDSRVVEGALVATGAHLAAGTAAGVVARKNSGVGVGWRQTVSALEDSFNASLPLTATIGAALYPTVGEVGAMQLAEHGIAAGAFTLGALRGLAGARVLDSKKPLDISASYEERKQLFVEAAAATAARLAEEGYVSGEVTEELLREAILAVSLRRRSSFSVKFLQKKLGVTPGVAQRISNTLHRANLTVVRENGKARYKGSAPIPSPAA